MQRISRFLKQFDVVIDASYLESMLNATQSVFHGMLRQDLDSVLKHGFLTRPGKCNFSIDLLYTMKKYGTLGCNSRHYYGSSYRADVEKTAKELGLEINEHTENKVRKKWAQSSEYTTLLVFATPKYFLRPGLGGTLYERNKILYGGISKWLHWHLSLVPEALSSDWEKNRAQRERFFLVKQDRRYGTNFAQQVDPGEINHLIVRELETDLWIPPAQIVGALVVSPEFRELVTQLPHLDKRYSLNRIRHHIANPHSWLYINELPLAERDLANAIVRGIKWGQLVFRIRRLFLSLAVAHEYQVVKVDSPGGQSNIQLLNPEERHQEFYSLLYDQTGDDHDYREYKKRCLAALQTGWKR